MVGDVTMEYQEMVVSSHAVWAEVQIYRGKRLEKKSDLFALRMAKTQPSFGYPECKMVNH